MKKYLFFALAVGTLVACDPLKDEESFVVDTVNAEKLLEGATFSQYNDAACTEPAEDGNYIKYNIPNATGVVIYYLKKDGSEFILNQGKYTAGGVICYVPLRGSDPNQTLYFRFINAEGVETVATHNFTLQVAKELSPEMKLICSNTGEKVWTWAETGVNGGAVWGNGGNSGGSFDFSSCWWGCGPIGGSCGDDFSGQMNHSSTGNVEETELGAYMTFNEDGSVKKFSKDGKEIGTGTFEIKDWTGGTQENWVAGKLNVTNGAILFPFMINSGGKVIESYNLSILTADQLVLTYYETDPGSWGETTWWSFGSNSDSEGMLTANDAKSWTWGPDANGRVWGNAGNAGGVWDGSSIWWGCGPIGGTADGDFSGQMNHSSTGNIEETMLGAYMTFNADGSITKHAADGTKIGEGLYEIKDYTTAQENWKSGILHVTNGAVLFPFMINSEGKIVEDFNISKMTGSQLVLTYYETDPGSWGETTWWSFEAK